MDDLRPHFVLGEKKQGWHPPVCWIKCLVPVGCSVMMFTTGNASPTMWITAASERLFLCRHRDVWSQCSQQPLPGPVLGKERDVGLLVPMAVSHLQPLQEMPPSFPWDVQCLLLALLGLTLTCTVLSPTAPGQDHAAVEANTGILLPVEDFSSWGAAPQSRVCTALSILVQWSG